MATSIEPVLTVSMVVLFWSSLTVLCYNYVGYPVLVFLAAKFFPLSDGELRTSAQTQLPRVTVLIVAYNAEHHIRERIRNILACEYPEDRLEIVVASDGSSDATVSLVEDLGQPHVRALAFSERRGKTRTLVDTVRQVDSDVILFTDATNQFERDSIHNLVRHFADPQIGIVTGKVAMIDERGQPVESVYWNMEMMIRRAEMRLGIMLGANGPIYAIRHSLFVEPKRPVINDDLVLPMLAHLRHGCGIIHDETAQAYMLSSGGLASEFRRRCRIGAGAFQSVTVLTEMYRWRHAKHAIAFTSHKLMRWIGPFLLAVLLATSLALAADPVYRSFFRIQMAAYSLAVAGLFAPNRGYVTRLARFASSFLVLNLALLAGFFQWVRQPEKVVWNPTVRPVLGQVRTIPQDLR